MSRIEPIAETKSKPVKKPSEWLQFAIEAMNPLEKDETEALIQKADSLEELLKMRYEEHKTKADFMLIGGILNNTHTQFAKKIDLLILYKGQKGEALSNGEPTIETILTFRTLTKKYLDELFPEAHTDDSQPLALQMSIPSWSCSFCLHFGFWHTNRTSASGINSLMSKVHVLNKDNLLFNEMAPIQAMFQLNTKDTATNDNTKVLIRILKSLKAKSEHAIPLSGHEITSLVFSMDDYTLKKQHGQLLFLLLECSLFLKRLEDAIFLQRTLKSPDLLALWQGDYNERLFTQGIVYLKAELDTLIKHLVLEIDLYTNVNNIPSNFNLT
jgi:hypothetical protein